MRRGGIGALVCAGIGVLWVWGAVAADEPARDRFDTVVLDPGHGGDDEGARGPGGLLEKDVVLAIARRVKARLGEHDVRVVTTRDADEFVSLEQRTHAANDARADLFVSIHANAAPRAEIRGTETFFLSMDASDEAARRLADRENHALGAATPRPAVTDDPVLAILGDLLETEHLQESQVFAGMAQAQLARLDPEGSRGVKQAPFVVLAGVQMPASLVEIGFITHPGEEKRLRTAERQEAIATALVRAVLEYGRRYDARRAAGAASRGGS